MKSKKSKKPTKRLNKSKKLEATKPLSVTHSDFTINKPVDASSPKLMN